MRQVKRRFVICPVVAMEVNLGLYLVTVNYSNIMADLRNALSQYIISLVNLYAPGCGLSVLITLHAGITGARMIMDGLSLWFLLEGND